MDDLQLDNLSEIRAVAMLLAMVEAELQKEDIKNIGFLIIDLVERIKR